MCFAIAALIIGGAYFYLSQDTSAPERQTIAPQQTTTESAFPALSELPARLTIETVGVNAPIIPVGLTKDGDMDAPNNVTDIGWYNQSAKAGEGRYSILLDGHHGVNERAVFEHLKKVKVGETILLTTDKGTVLTFEIREIETTPYQEVDMKRALMPYKKGGQSMTIITCEGEYSQTKKTYDNRTVVYAERVK